MSLRYGGPATARGPWFFVSFSLCFILLLVIFSRQRHCSDTATPSVKRSPWSFLIPETYSGLADLGISQGRCLTRFRKLCKSNGLAYGNAFGAAAVRISQ
ncbi:hypothetical protein B0H66DRAFT_556403 [Apodospora peruviana]|uniref:Uncharacterized protein n=1 Tax=Apodospora peruviana TaxID=516989 RepID=A0AAE0M3X9_9PEZI|nr:hypothetical protein B0H66DRAFT_556403 [Apodospora peruviana]